ncbi:SLC45 family MFS transporter [Verticiella sediminum]|uniref:SLC45 family MFS transporter n=1 Tax=Verticiella sediminum TaxID=1247510 RepID=A0A556AMS4_9BURK|nr:MFS transporter [Verticiella sediminum]TSH94189.1 SLC45 family MFS transporter [Verticiella sediminum]
MTTTSNPQIARFNKSAAFFVALAIFAQESVWNFYDAQVPASLRQYVSSAAVIGLLMGVDNLLGIFVQPWMAHRSDQYKANGGNRLRFLLVGATLAALLFSLIPWANSFGMLLVSMIGFAFVANGFKSITESLTADYQAPNHRSKGNAVARIGVALTILASAAISFIVVDRDLRLAFLIPAMLLVIGMYIACWGLSSRKPYGAAQESDAGPPLGLKALVLDIFTSPDKRRLLLLFAVFGAQGTWTAIRSQLTPYAMEVLELSRGAAGSIGFPAGIAFLVAAIPVAIIAERTSRALVCMLGMAVIALGCVAIFFSTSAFEVSAAMAVVAVGWAAFTINAVAILWSIALHQRYLGTYTGLYWTAAAVGQTLMPALLGLLVDLTAWRYMMLHAAGFACLSVLLLLKVVRSSTPGPGGRTAEVRDHRLSRSQPGDNA